MNGITSEYKAYTNIQFIVHNSTEYSIYLICFARISNTNDDIKEIENWTNIHTRVHKIENMVLMKLNWNKILFT